MRHAIPPFVRCLWRYVFNIVPAKAGTHTPRPLVCRMMIDGLRFKERLLTFVRTTRACDRPAPGSPPTKAAPASFPGSRRSRGLGPMSGMATPSINAAIPESLWLPHAIPVFASHPAVQPHASDVPVTANIGAALTIADRLRLAHTLAPTLGPTPPKFGTGTLPIPACVHIEVRRSHCTGGAAREDADHKEQRPPTMAHAARSE